MGQSASSSAWVAQALLPVRSLQRLRRGAQKGVRAAAKLAHYRVPNSGLVQIGLVNRDGLGHVILPLRHPSVAKQKRDLAP